MKKHKILLILIALGLFAVLVAHVFSNPAEETDRIYTNIYIHGVSVGGLTAEEANAALMERFQPELEARTIEYHAGGNPAVAFTFADFGATYDFGNLISAALNYANLRNLPQRLMRILGRAHNINEPALIQISPERMESILCEISRKIDRPPVNASFVLENGNINVIPEAQGFGIDINHITNATDEILNSQHSGVVNITLLDFAPLFTTENFQFDVSTLGAFQTTYTDSHDTPRMYNIRLAADRINNQTVYPGGVFSAGAIIAANAQNSGYKSAIVLVRGEPVEDVGGGVCQVVTTLYNAVLAAELEIVQRHNHSSLVSYVEYGFDATVAGDYFDLKFRNNTEHPLLVTSEVTNGRLTVAIHGSESRPAERSIRFSTNRVDIISPGPYREIVDAAIPAGERHIILESQMGYKYELIKHVYINGVEVETIVINTSTYRALQGVVAIGAG